MRIFIFFLCIGLCVSAVGAQVRPLTLSNLCTQADRVVVGGVNKIESRWEGSKIVTDVTIAPTENLKGVGSVPFAITVPGGTVDGVTLRVSAAPVLLSNIAAWPGATTRPASLHASPNELAFHEPESPSQVEIVSLAGPSGSRVASVLLPLANGLDSNDLPVGTSSSWKPTMLSE